ncbi:MAG: hypothetical protein IMW93_06155 [Thermoanaerobacteraceae bacterium]|nr:hypothetical protein [Thermoanaerobacteraceae bacterium]
MITEQPVQDEMIQSLIKEILTTLKEKFTRPLQEEINHLAAAVNELKEAQALSHRETRELISGLEHRVDRTPLVMLGAMRDAIQQVEKEG